MRRGVWFEHGAVVGAGGASEQLCCLVVAVVAVCSLSQSRQGKKADCGESLSTVEEMALKTKAAA